jgi:alpha-L-arabinofuranosidase
MNPKWFRGLGMWLFLLCGATAQEAKIVVHADQVSHRLSRYLTGACIEDVNHEIYGGLYSQMIFGESFQEPSPPIPLRGFTAYGGHWQPESGTLRAEGGDGPKLVADAPVFEAREAGVEMYLPGGGNGNAGLIVKVSEAGEGADNFVGYEIALEPGGRLVLGRHRHNWEPIRSLPQTVPVNQWFALVVRMATNRLEVSINGRSVLRYEDRDHPLASGQVGLRTWQHEARFRNLYTKTGSQITQLSFELAEGESARRGVSGQWRAFRRGSATGAFSLETNRPFAGLTSQRIALVAGEGEIGVENQGLNRWGMNFIKGKRYEGYLWLRAEQSAALFLALESADGTKRYAESQVAAKGNEWQRVEFKLTPHATDAAGRFVIGLKRPGSVCIGHAFIQPGEWGRFRGLPVRKDVTEALIAQGLTVLRYGGSMINCPEYRWKKMIGPPDRRPPYAGTWYRYSSNGWGIFDFLNFGEAAGFLGIPTVNVDEAPQDMADFVEYVNGSPRSEWGGRRAADGHPAPYHLSHLELGNEEAINEAYWIKFKALAEAIWAKDPTIILVVGDFAYDKIIQDPYNFSGAPSIKTLAAHQKILDLAREQDREVWFDVHIGTEHPPEPHGVPGLRSLIEQLGRLSPGARFKVAVFEFNANNHALKRALGNACAINQLERAGDHLAVACSANCLQPDRQNDNGWDQGLLFLSPGQVWPQPPYYVTQMAARSYLPLAVRAEAQSRENTLDVAASKSEDGKTLVLKTVNCGNSPVSAGITLRGFKPQSPAAHVAALTGDWDGINTPSQPGHIKPTESEWHFESGAGMAVYSFPPRSFTVLQFK